MVAAFKGNIETVKQVLQKGAVVDARNTVGVTPLMLAAGKGHVEVAKLLLENGALINAKSIGGGTPLLLAVLEGHYAMVKLLLEKGVDFSVEFHGLSPLWFAETQGFKEIGKLLREAGVK